jgi:hypothetical protein
MDKHQQDHASMSDQQDRASTSDGIKPLVDAELDAVTGGMTAVFIAGNMSVAVWATPTAHGVITTTCGC